MRGFKLLVYALLAIVALAYWFPYAWMVLSSFKTTEEILTLPIRILPRSLYVYNYVFLVTEFPFLNAYINSLVIASLTTILVIFTSTLAGYVLAKLEFKGRDVLFMLVLAMQMIPFFVTIIPNYKLIASLGLLNTYWAVIIPSMVSPFGIFLMRQFMLTIPDDLLDAARVDGCTELEVLFRVVFPLCKPAWIVLGVTTFIASWNDFLWPLLVLRKKEMYTVPLLLNLLGVAAGDPRYYGVLMAGNTLGTIPTLIIGALAFRRIVEGMRFTGLKM